MPDLLLPFAKRMSDERLVGPDEVARGLACECVCPDCGHPVQARQGTEKVWHFAHARASDCANAYEKSVHSLAKQMLKECNSLLLPALTITEEARDAFRPRLLRASETAFDKRSVHFDTCRADQVIGDVSPDLVATIQGRTLLIEITVFHRLMPDKKARLKKTGFATLQIDLSRFRTRQATRELLVKALFESEDNRFWVWHPMEEGIRQRLIAALQEQVDASRAQLEAMHHGTGGNVPLNERRSEPTRSTHDHHIVWRASFPPDEQRAAALRRLCATYNLSIDRAVSVTSQVKNRGDLARVTPAALAERWRVALGIPTEAVYAFFMDGGYTLG